MCTMSMVGDHYMDLWRPYTAPGPVRVVEIHVDPNPTRTVIGPDVTRAEFDQLKRQVDEMVLLLKRAQKYDEDNGEPHCETDEKMEVLRKVAKLVGVDLDQALAPKPS